MPDVTFRPKKNFGEELVTVSASNISPTANSTVTFYFPPVARKSRIGKIAVQCSTVPVDSDGALTATAYKVSDSGTTSTALSAAFNLEGLTANVVSSFDLSSIAETVRNRAATDAVKVEVISTSAGFDTAAAGLHFSIEHQVKE